MRTLMEEVSEVSAVTHEGRLRGAVPSVKTAPPVAAPGKLILVAYSVADQALAVGGGFLVNVALARVQTKEEYGMFALSYSVFIFLAGLHNAAILEPFTVYGSGRYRERFSAYLRLMARSNALLAVALSGILLLTCLLLSAVAPRLVSRSLIGLGLAVGFLLSGLFLRRSFYVQRQPAFAAKSSLVFFLTVACGVWLAARRHRLDSFWAFSILALGWFVAGIIYARKLHFQPSQETFLQQEPAYWGVHWRYARWVLITAFVFQLMTQGYYWLVAGFLSVKEVAELRAMLNLISPVDQLFVAMCYLALPAMAAHFAAKRMDKLVTLSKKFALAILAVNCLFALGIRVFGKQVMHVVYAGKFDGMSTLLFTLALLPMFMAVGNTMAQALNASEKPMLVFYGFLSSAAATVFLGTPLVIHFGLRGAVYGMLLSGATFTVAISIGFLFTVYREARKRTTPMALAGIITGDGQ
jgi:O-antigen/teichoic acid export membrane protein